MNKSEIKMKLNNFLGGIPPQEVVILRRPARREISWAFIMPMQKLIDILAQAGITPDILRLCPHEHLYEVLEKSGSTCYRMLGGRYDNDGWELRIPPGEVAVVWTGYGGRVRIIPGMPE